jgi:hypothetical protein
MVSCAGEFSWISNDATRLAKIIDLLRDRNLKADQARVRGFLKNEATPPDVRKSAILYAARVRDTGAVDCLSNILSDASRLRDADDTIFALVSLNPKHKWVNEWITNLTEQPPDRNKLAQAAVVAANLMQSLERRRLSSWPFELEELEQAVDFAATVASLIISKGGRFFLLDRSRIGIFVPWHRGFDNVVIKDSLFLGLVGKSFRSFAVS